MSDIKSQIKFGTDGWRAVISDTFTFENVRIVAQAVADWVNKNNPQYLLKSASVGYDNRFLSAEYARAVAEVFAANGIKTYLSDTSLPTPTLSLGVVTLKNVGGIMITASHNPAQYNGMKFTRSEAQAISLDTGLAEIRNADQAADALRRNMPIANQHRQHVGDRQRIERVKKDSDAEDDGDGDVPLRIRQPLETRGDGLLRQRQFAWHLRPPNRPNCRARRRLSFAAAAAGFAAGRAGCTR